MKPITIDISTIDYTKPISYYCTIYDLSWNALRNRFKKMGIYDNFRFTGNKNCWGKDKQKNLKLEYERNPKKCEECGIAISYEKKDNDFCSSHCSCTYSNRIRMESGYKVSDEHKLKISNIMREKVKNGTFVNSNPYKERISVECAVCKAIFKTSEFYIKAGRKFCSRKCADVGKDKSNMGGYREEAGKGKMGRYRGVYCNSSWELAWVIYAFDHGIRFERNNKGFEYTFEGKIRKYYPDFVLEDGSYLEVKGYQSIQWEAKKDQFPHKLTILARKEMKPYLEYAISKYGKDFLSAYDVKTAPLSIV